MCVVLAMTACISPAAVVDFSDLSLNANSHWNGSDGSGGFSSGGVTFDNNYDTDYGSWYGFSYSNVNNTTTKAYSNQYASFTGTGMGGGGIYAVGCVYINWMTGEAVPIVATLDTPSRLGTVGITNTTVAALTMRDGNAFAKKFGGADGADPDWFKLTIIGKDAAGSETGSVDFYLADYRTDTKYIVDTWQLVDLSSLGTVKTLEFTLSSTDNDSQYGMNTPAYFALDNLTVIPEPATVGLLVLGAGALIRRRKM
jgi:hypothetical protein